MIQEIGPHILHADFSRPKPQPEDYVMLFGGGGVLLLPETHALLKVADWRALGGNDGALLHILQLDGVHFFLVLDVPERMRAALKVETTRFLRTVEPDWLRLGAVTALHLYNWHRTHRFCGVCGQPMRPDGRELAMRCTSCNAVTYPTVFPAIIVGIVDGERILLTRSSVYENPVYALVSGYMGVGETLEQCVAREAFEETGLRLKNIRYFGNQPWGFSGAQMIGFWAELDGSNAVRLQREELKEAKWFLPEEMPETPEPIDLTHYMMEQFRQRKLPWQR